MNQEKFLNLITNPNAVSKKQTNALEVIIEEFPYFQTARVLHLKGLKNQRSFKYNNSLKKTAAYTTNRTVLFDFITKDIVDYETILDNEKEILDEIEVIDSKVIDNLYQSINVSKKNNDILIELAQIENLFPSSKSTEIQKPIEISVKNNELKSESNKTILKEEKQHSDLILEIGKPLNFKQNDVFSFNEWLQLDVKNPIKRNTEVIKIEKIIEKGSEKLIKTEPISINFKENTSNKNDLIEAFIKNKPKIKPIKNQTVSNISMHSTTENTNLMTETLARVYLEQKKYKKAIAAFKILSLKYPEKSSFFANQIKAVKSLENNKS